MKVALLSNINIDFIAKTVTQKVETYQPSGFGAWLQVLSEATSALYQNNISAVFILLDGATLLTHCKTLEEGYEELATVMSYIQQAVLEQQHLTFFVSTLDIFNQRIDLAGTMRWERLWEAKWYHLLAELKAHWMNFYLFDLKQTIEEMGRQNAYSQKLWYAAGMKYSLKCSQEMAQKILTYIKALEGNRKKCLVLDLDHTLWGGVIGEDGLHGIELSEQKEGARYYDLQKRIQELKDTGVLLAVVSKNNEADAKEPFLMHPHMLIKMEDLVAFKANWNPKSDNLRALAKELNIGLDALVLLDDSAVERATIETFLPEVCVIDFPKDTTQLAQVMVDAFEKYFFACHLTREDQEKTMLYQQQFKRKEAIHKALQVEDYLKSLQTNLHVHLMKTEDLQRVTQLTQKTNQFNVTTRRYTEKEMKDMAQASDHLIYTGHVKDRFGDSGMVIVLIVKIKGDTAHIDTFLMSCRVMGRKIEQDAFSVMARHLLGRGIRHITALYLPTVKNLPVEDLYEQLGFEVVKRSDEGIKQYHKNLHHEGIQPYQYTVVDFEG